MKASPKCFLDPECPTSVAMVMIRVVVFDVVVDLTVAVLVVAVGRVVFVNGEIVKLPMVFVVMV